MTEKEKKMGNRENRIFDIEMGNRKSSGHLLSYQQVFRSTMSAGSAGLEPKEKAGTAERADGRHGEELP